MKITLFVFLFLCAAAAFGQNAAVIPNEPQITQFAEHPQHADARGMGVERPIVGASHDGISYAQGERPLWEFGPVSTPVPLGDVARAFRNQKSTAKKAEITLEKQGS